MARNLELRERSLAELSKSYIDMTLDKNGSNYEWDSKKSDFSQRSAAYAAKDALSSLLLYRHLEPKIANFNREQNFVVIPPTLEWKKGQKPKDCKRCSCTNACALFAISQTKPAPFPIKSSIRPKVYEHAIACLQGLSCGQGIRQSTLQRYIKNVTRAYHGIQPCNRSDRRQLTRESMQILDQLIKSGIVIPAIV